MTTRWDRVTALFGAARALDGEHRAAFLDVACPEGDPLRRDVEVLLAADLADDSFLQAPPWAIPGDPGPTTLEPGTVLKGRYRIEAPLGTGGQALVFQATDQLLTRLVVIKVMRTEGRGSPWLASRFEREMVALALIDHPAVVGILDVGELDDRSPFLVIQHVTGMSLREALARGPLPRQQLGQIISQMAGALQAAHAAGIAHRDLKPDNVMLHSPAEDGVTVKLIDFGIAKIERDDVAPNTTTILVAGTVRYMAPEQFEGKHSRASDIYSMALIVCELLGGRPDLRTLPRSTPRRVRAALESALAFQPEDRPPDIGRWSEELVRGLQTGVVAWQRAAAALVVAAALVAGTVAIQGWVSAGDEVPERIVEKVGPFDPVTEGFSIGLDVTGRIVENPTRTGYDGWRILTSTQGYYYRAFTTAQKRQALQRGWKLTAVLKVEQGGGSVGADFSGVGRRYGINILRMGDHEVVRLITQLVPDMRGLDVELPRDDNYHTYELSYDPQLKTAELYVDGVRRLTGYRGHTQFQEDTGLLFSSHVYGSDQGSATFRSVRFEINP
jgi:tRNA A-37 threonylcarbamoyl transferase component Bud32